MSWNPFRYKKLEKTYISGQHLINVEVLKSEMNKKSYKIIRIQHIVYVSFMAVLLLASCSPKLHTSSREVRENGNASYYGGKFHGRTTASGERFNQNAMTAAHRTLPFGTKVTVKNLSNGKQVVVKINDRGPSSKSRVIDLSKGAAKKIGMIQAGVVPVELRYSHGVAGTGKKNKAKKNTRVKKRSNRKVKN